MPRSVRDSDDDFELKAATGRVQTRMFTVQSVSSPVRRSSRIKQNKYSPGSESDSSTISNSQATRTRARTATMDFTVSDTTKKLRSRKLSISSDISEADVDIPRTPGKRITRQSLGAVVGTPTRVNTRAASKRFVRAVSETQSPLPAARIHKTRASSVGLESSSDQNKSRSDSLVKTRRQAAILPSSSLAKEQIELEDRIPYVRLDATIIEADEITSSGNSDSSPNKALSQSQKITKHQSINKDEIEDDSRKTSTDSSKDELQSLEKKDETQAEDMDKATMNNTEDTLAEGQYKLEKILPSDNNTIDEVSTYCSSSSGCQNSAKEDKTKIVETLSDIEKSLINICESIKGSVPEDLLDISTEEQKSDKENEMLNINSDVSVEKSIQPNMTSSCIKSLASPFMNKSDEKETKSMKKELNKRRSRESTEIAIKHDDLSKEAADNPQEKMDISIESLSSTLTNKTVLLQHDSTKLDKVINKDETSIENVSTSTNEDSMEVISESNKIDKKECSVTDNKNSNIDSKIESDKIDKTSRSSINLVKSIYKENKDDSEESFTLISTTDDNEITLTLEERSPHQDENEVSNIAHSKSDQVDLQISSSVNESSDDQIVIIRDKTIDSSDSTKEKQEQENLSKHVTESALESSVTLETNNSAVNDSNDAITQHDKSSDIIEVSKKSTMDISPEKTDAKDILLEKLMKRNIKQKSTDVLDDLRAEKENSQMETNQKEQEKIEIVDNVSDVDGIDLFQDIPADKWKKKNDVKTDSVQSTSQSVGEVQNDVEAECDLILMDKQAWLTAENIKAAKEAESFEYDSDDTVLLKSRLDAAQASCNAEKLDNIDEELLMDISKENEKQVQKQKSRTKKRLTSEIDQDSSIYAEDKDNLVTSDKSFNESKTVSNRTNDRSISSRLNKSGQSARTKDQFSKASDESNKELENDASKLNRSSVISKKNTSLRKSMRGKTSLNKSSKDTCMQSISANKSRIDDSEGELDNTDAHTEKKLYKKKRSFNKSRNKDADDDVIKFEKKNVSIENNSEKNENTSLNRMDQDSKSDDKTIIYLNDDESNSDINIVAMDFGSKTYSMIANAGSDSSDQDECDISNYFAKANSDTDDSGSDTVDSSSNFDINREYNLNGVEPKFSDDNVLGDECRTSETEFSNSDDHGSDLADFIIDDDDVEDDEEDIDEDMQNIKEDNESENEQNVEENDEDACEEVEDEEDKQIHTESINTEDENEDDENIQEKYVANREHSKENKFAEIQVISSYASTSPGKLSKIHKSKSIENILPCISDTEIKQNTEIEKSSMKKNEKTILLDSSNSDLSKKKKKNKSLMKKNDTILSDASNLISSSIKKKRKSDPQYSSRDGAEQDFSEQLNKYEYLSGKETSRALKLKNTPHHNSSKKLEFDEILERISENKDIKLDNTIKAMQNTSFEKKKKKSKKDSTLNEDINLKKFYANKEKMSNSDFSPDLLKLLEKTSFSKATSSKIELNNKTMNIVDTETPTMKHLRKEKLNESAPTLKSNAKTSSLSTKKDTVQIKIKEKNNEDEILKFTILSNDDAIQKCSQKKQRKRKKRDISKENIDEAEDTIELDTPKKKKKLVKLTQLTIVDNNIRENVCQINEKKKKKQELSLEPKENFTNKISFENTVELKILKNKKPVVLTQLTTVDDIRGNVCRISEKKKQEPSRKNITDEAVSKDAIELKIPKKKKSIKPTQLTIIDDNIHEDAAINEKKKKKQDTSKESIIDEALAEDTVESKNPKKKKRAKLIQSPIVEDNTHEDICKINEKEKKKKKKRETVKENITEEALSEDAELKIPKKKKHAKLSPLTIMEDNGCKTVYQINAKEKKKKKGETLKENITEEALSEDAVELKISKKKKRAKLIQSPIVEDNTHEYIYQINEKEKKKKKKQKTLKEDITEEALSEDAVELRIPKKKKRVNLNQLAIVEDNIRKHAYQINEKEKKKNKKQINIAEEDKNVNKDNILRKNVRKNKTELAQQKKNKIINSLKLASPTDKYMIKKTKQQEPVKSIETLQTEKKKTTLPVQIPVSKLKSDKNLLSCKLLQKIALHASESKNKDCTKKLNEATAKMCIPKELKPKKKRNPTEDIENVIHVNVPTKKLKKEVKEVTKVLPSSSGLKRLSDDVIENLTDMPMKTKKRRKILRNKEQVSSVKTDKSKVMTADCDDPFMLSASGCTTQFHVVNLQNAKKQSLKGAAAAASFRQRMLARNNREPMSAYMMYCDKMNFIK